MDLQDQGVQIFKSLNWVCSHTHTYVCVNNCQQGHTEQLKYNNGCNEYYTINTIIAQYLPTRF